MTFVGNVVSIDCGDVLGTYQGVVASVDPSKNDITISQPFRNGTLCPHPKVTIWYVTIVYRLHKRIDLYFEIVVLIAKRNMLYKLLFC